VEQESLHSLRRGIFVKKKISKGDVILSKDIYFAFPPKKNQYTANDYSKYSSFKAKTEIKKDEAVSKNNSSISYHRLMLEEITKKVNGIISAAEIKLPSSIQMEISHHYGLEKFNEYGMVIFTLINRAYCKKLLISLPGQVHPAQYHKKKEESFLLMYGDLTLTLDNKNIKMKLGEVVTIEKGMVHQFSSKKGAIVEEISDTHNTDDSFYIDDKINLNDNRKTFINFYKNL
jgi:D-lyxose ketol-isomerase